MVNYRLIQVELYQGFRRSKSEGGENQQVAKGHIFGVERLSLHQGTIIPQRVLKSNISGMEGHRFALFN
jgi:hypothetical protein